LSKKYHQRTRSEILAKRNAPINKWAGWTRGVPARITKRWNADVRKASRSKYTPHTGVKEVERAKRCRMDFLHGPHAVFSENYRSAPTLCQLSKVGNEQEAWQREYDSECLF